MCWGAGEVMYGRQQGEELPLICLKVSSTVSMTGSEYGEQRNARL